MKKAIETSIQKYINSPTGTIKTVYPAIEYIDFKFIPGEEYYQGMPYYETTHDGVDVKVYLKYSVANEEELWRRYNVDPHYMMDYWFKDIYKLFGIYEMKYTLTIFAPLDGKWNEVMTIDSW